MNTTKNVVNSLQIEGVLGKRTKKRCRYNYLYKSCTNKYQKNMVILKALERRNPQDVNAVNKFYAKAISQGVIDFERLAYLVSNQCTVRVPDCLAVLC